MFVVFVFGNRTAVIVPLTFCQNDLITIIIVRDTFSAPHVASLLTTSGSARNEREHTPTTADDTTTKSRTVTSDRDVTTTGIRSEF